MGTRSVLPGSTSIARPTDAASPTHRFRRVRLDRVRALFDAWASLDNIVSPEAGALRDAVISALKEDREHYSDIFEASIQVAKSQQFAFRFSYAFPGFRADPALSIRHALAAAAPFGPRVTASVKRLFRAALHAVVEQPLIGIAWDRGSEPRHKVYLQLRDDAGAEGVHHVAEVLGMPFLNDALRDMRLHMVGVDFGSHGVTGAKLYVVHSRVERSSDDGIARTAALLDPAAVAFHNVLAIHRLDAGSALRAALPSVSDIDVGLDEAGPTWDRVSAAPAIAPILQRSRIWAELRDNFVLGPRRVSISVRAPHALTVYYGLREVEES
ncbi:MAG: hypothetical protein IPK82_18465 [Polyangiaceae bacterium]|nr:hypothetical protein [Polyangiaceae bacterium]